MKGGDKMHGRTAILWLCALLVIGVGESYAGSGKCSVTITPPSREASYQVDRSSLPFVVCWRGWVCGELDVSRIQKKIDELVERAENQAIEAVENDDTGRIFDPFEEMHRIAKSLAMYSSRRDEKMSFEKGDEEKSLSNCYQAADMEPLLKWASWYSGVYPLWRKEFKKEADELRRDWHEMVKYEDLILGRHGVGGETIVEGLIDKKNRLEGDLIALKRRARELTWLRQDIIDGKKDAEERIAVSEDNVKRVEKIKKRIQEKRNQLEALKRKEARYSELGRDDDARIVREKIKRLEWSISGSEQTLEEEWAKDAYKELIRWRKIREDKIRENKKIINELTEIANKIRKLKKRLEPLRKEADASWAKMKKFQNSYDEKKRKLKKGVQEFLELNKRQIPHIRAVSRTLTARVSLKDRAKSQDVSPVISGRIRDDEGKPVEGAEVSVTISGKRYTARSGKDGRYRIKLPGGLNIPEMMKFSASKEGYKAGFASISRTFILHADITLKKSLSSEQGLDISGTYRVSGVNPNGTTYQGTVKVSRNGQNRYDVFWQIGGSTWNGKGEVRRDGRFYVKYTGAFAGDGIWEIEDNGNLKGVWRAFGGSGQGTEDWFKGSD